MLSYIPGTRHNRMKKLFEQADQLLAAVARIGKQDPNEGIKGFMGRQDVLDEVAKTKLAVIAAESALDMTAFRTQVACALALLQNTVVEMQTGEGKTLAAALAAAVHASFHRQVHVATVNDYLAKRDATALAPFFAYLGLSVACVTPGMSHAEKQAAYRCNVVYSTAQEIAFDYLRDNMAESSARVCIPSMDTLIIDEADSILLDQACMPLQIAGESRPVTQLYGTMTAIVQAMVSNEDAQVDRKDMHVSLSEEAMDNIEAQLEGAGFLKGSKLYDSNNRHLAHALQCCLAANFLYRRDKEYVVSNGQILIVDEHTGRVLDGRRWSDGIHQAVEAKEGLPIRPETPIKAAMTYQSFIKLYERVSGLTGTAATSANELTDMYGLDVVAIPPHKPSIRKDDPDLIFLTKEDKYAAITKEVIRAKGRLQPVLIGTDSIEESERLYAALAERGIDASLLSAREHTREAEIIADAGTPGTVTIATQMAGRGTDIVLGGDLLRRLKWCEEHYPGDKSRRDLANESWLLDRELANDAGGLLVIGANRAPSIRADHQLRGRAGRQGDPGHTMFFVSLEDDLIVSHGAKTQLDTLSQRMSLGPGEALEGRFINKIVRQAQQARQSQDELLRKELLKYDSVTTLQRETFYLMRKAVVQMLDDGSAKALEQAIDDSIQHAVNMVMRQCRETCATLKEEQAMACSLASRYWNVSVPAEAFGNTATSEALEELLHSFAKQYWSFRKDKLKDEIVMPYMGLSLLKSFDSAWEGIQARMAELRDGIGLRSYANETPLNSFRREGYEIMADIKVEAMTMAGMKVLGSTLPEGVIKM